MRNDYHLCQLLSLLSKNNKVLFFGVPEALCLTNSRYNELLWVPLKVRYTGSSLYFHIRSVCLMVITSSSGDVMSIGEISHFS